jgi:hypothetical protein
VTSTEQQIEHFVVALEFMGGSAGNQRPGRTRLVQTGLCHG